MRPVIIRILALALGLGLLHGAAAAEEKTPRPLKVDKAQAELLTDSQVRYYKQLDGLEGALKITESTLIPVGDKLQEANEQIFYLDIKNKKFRVDVFGYTDTSNGERKKVQNSREYNVDGKIFFAQYGDTGTPGDMMVSKPGKNSVSKGNLPTIFRFSQYLLAISDKQNQANGQWDTISTIITKDVGKYVAENAINTTKQEQDGDKDFLKGDIGVALKGQVVENVPCLVVLRKLPFTLTSSGFLPATIWSEGQARMTYKTFHVGARDLVLIGKSKRGFSLSEITSIELIPAKTVVDTNIFDPMQVDPHKIFDADRGMEIEK